MAEIQEFTETFEPYPHNVSPNLIVGQLATICMQLNRLVELLAANDGAIAAELAEHAETLANITSADGEGLTVGDIESATLNQHGFIRIV